MNNNFVIITSNELRHIYFYKSLCYLNPKSFFFIYEEYNSQSQLITSKKNKSKLFRDHFLTRKQTEEDFFFNFSNYKPSNLKKIKVKYGNINNNTYLKQLEQIKPKYIFSFGSSILNSQMISLFKNKMINVHLGISPKYRGAGTNFFPIINKEIQYLGVTYMFTNEVIDGGDIIHQETPNIYLNDNVHIIGNRIISKIPFTLSKLIKIPNLNKHKKKQYFLTDDKVYKKKDFNTKILKNYLKNYKQNINQFVKNKKVAKNLISIV